MTYREALEARIQRVRAGLQSGDSEIMDDLRRGTRRAVRRIADAAEGFGLYEKAAYCREWAGE